MQPKPLKCRDYSKARSTSVSALHARKKQSSTYVLELNQMHQIHHHTPSISHKTEKRKLSQSAQHNRVHALKKNLLLYQLLATYKGNLLIRNNFLQSEYSLMVSYVHRGQMSKIYSESSTEQQVSRQAEKQGQCQSIIIMLKNTDITLIKNQIKHTLRIQPEYKSKHIVFDLSKSKSNVIKTIQIQKENCIKKFSFIAENLFQSEQTIKEGEIHFIDPIKHIQEGIKLRATKFFNVGGNRKRIVWGDNLVLSNHLKTENDNSEAVYIEEKQLTITNQISQYQINKIQQKCTESEESIRWTLDKQNQTNQKANEVQYLNKIGSEPLQESNKLFIWFKNNSSSNEVGNQVYGCFKSQAKCNQKLLSFMKLKEQLQGKTNKKKPISYKCDIENIQKDLFRESIKPLQKQMNQKSNYLNDRQKIKANNVQPAKDILVSTNKTPVIYMQTCNKSSRLKEQQKGAKNGDSHGNKSFTPMIKSVNVTYVNCK